MYENPMNIPNKTRPKVPSRRNATFVEAELLAELSQKMPPTEAPTEAPPHRSGQTRWVHFSGLRGLRGVREKQPDDG